MRRRLRALVRPRTSADDERGAAAVEFALVVPLLLLLLFGIISYGYMLSFRQALSQGAAEGVRAAAVSSATDIADLHLAAEEAVNEALSSYGIQCGDGNLTCTPVVDDTCSCVTVTLDYDYEKAPLTPALPGFGPVMPDHLLYTASAKVS